MILGLDCYLRAYFLNTSLRVGGRIEVGVGVEVTTEDSAEVDSVDIGFFRGGFFFFSSGGGGRAYSAGG